MVSDLTVAMDSSGNPLCCIGKSCGKPLSKRDYLAYGLLCEDCWVNGKVPTKSSGLSVKGLGRNRKGRIKPEKE